jgi:hypothetical protein
LLGAAWSCEKDDICVDGDTALLVLRFYDNAAPESSKAVSRLRVIGLGQDAPVNTFADRSNLDSIALPLRPGEPETSFILIFNSQDGEGGETGNADTLRFNYETREVFISRACGFVAQYEGLGAELQIGTGNWIQNVEVVNPTVQTLQPHVSVFH